MEKFTKGSDKTLKIGRPKKNEPVEFLDQELVRSLVIAFYGTTYELSGKKISTGSVDTLTKAWYDWLNFKFPEKVAGQETRFLIIANLGVFAPVSTPLLKKLPDIVMKIIKNRKGL